MRFFDAVPSDLFSPLASPNRALYADALDVLYTAYRENLKIREDALYSMLRSRLEQQLADATFDGEDIDEEELRDISGRARFLIRKLCSKGWFEKERGNDFEEYITVPSYSSRLLELFHQLRDDSPVRGYSYVFGTFSALKVAHESGSVYDKMAAIYSAYDNTSALINLLQMVYHNVKHYFQMQLEMQDVNQVLASHFNDFGQKVIEAYIRPLKIKDSVPKYRVPIQTILKSWKRTTASCWPCPMLHCRINENLLWNAAVLTCCRKFTGSKSATTIWNRTIWRRSMLRYGGIPELRHKRSKT